MKKLEILIFVLLLLTITGCTSSKNETVVDDINTDTGENNTINSSTVNSTLASNSNQETTMKSEATTQLELSYDDIQIEYARVIANLGVENKIGYTLERVTSNQVTFDTSVSDKYKNIHIKEVGVDDRYIYYLPLGEGFIEHYGMRKYPPGSTMSPAKTYLKTEYDDIALQLLKNQNNVSDNDLNIEAINSGDLSTLVGNWINGNGDTLIINSDGTTNKDWVVYGVQESDKTSKIPYASLSTGGPGGATLGLYKIGFKNPDGDNSDSTKPRLTIAQNGGNYSSESYYYRN